MPPTNEPSRTGVVPLYLIGLTLPFFLAYLASPYVAEAHLTFADTLGVLIVAGLVVPWILDGIVRWSPSQIRSQCRTFVEGGLLALAIVTWVDWRWDWGLATLGLGAWLVVGTPHFPPRLSRGWAFCLNFLAVVVFATAVHLENFKGVEQSAGLKIKNHPPIVVLFFDQLSLPMILDQAGNINRDRFPNLRSFSEESDWFYRTSSLRPSTTESVPMLLTGKYLTKPIRRATYRNFPGNLFTWLSDEYQIQGFEQFTRLCPPSLCSLISFPHGWEATQIQIADWGLWWLTKNLPTSLQTGLPSLRNAPYDLWNLSDRPKTFHRKQIRLTAPSHRHVQLALDHLELAPRRLHYFHFLCPHQPFQYYPSGGLYWHQGNHAKPTIVFGEDDEEAERMQHVFARYQLQVGFADRALGQFLRKLKDQKLYESAWVIVLSDHGMAVRPSRRLRPDHLEPLLPEVYSVPLLVKRPFQKRGRRLLHPVELVDLAPTLLKALQASPFPPGLDGQSLYRPRDTAGKLEYMPNHTFRYEPIKDFSPRKAAQYYQAHFHSHLPMEAVYGWGKGADYLGKSIASLSMGGVSRLHWRRTALRQRAKKFQDFPSGMLNLKVSQARDTRAVVLAANGIITNAFRIPGGEKEFPVQVVIPETTIGTPIENWEMYEVHENRLLPMPRSPLG